MKRSALETIQSIIEWFIKKVGLKLERSQIKGIKQKVKKEKPYGLLTSLMDNGKQIETTDMKTQKNEKKSELNSSDLKRITETPEFKENLAIIEEDAKRYQKGSFQKVIQETYLFLHRKKYELEVD